MADLSSDGIAASLLWNQRRIGGRWPPQRNRSAVSIALPLLERTVDRVGRGLSSRGPERERARSPLLIQIECLPVGIEATATELRVAGAGLAEVIDLPVPGET